MACRAEDPRCSSRQDPLSGVCVCVCVCVCVTYCSNADLAAGRLQMCVPECFKEVVLDSRRWLQEKEEKEARLAALISNPAEISCKLISLLFSKMHDAASDAAYAAAHAAAYAAADAASGARRAGAGAGAAAAGGASGTSGLSISSHSSSNLSNAGAEMTHHIHEMNLQAAGHVGEADLETMHLVSTRMLLSQRPACYYASARASVHLHADVC